MAAATPPDSLLAGWACRPAYHDILMSEYKLRRAMSTVWTKFEQAVRLVLPMRAKKRLTLGGEVVIYYIRMFE